MRSSVLSLEHEVERLKEEIKEVETVRAGVFFFEAFCYLKHALGLCCKSELPRTSLLQVVQPVLQFKLNLLAGVFKKERSWVLEVVLVFTSVLTHWGSSLVRLSSLLLDDHLGLNSFSCYLFEM